MKGGGTAARAAELRRLLERANHAYYVLDKPEISDADARRTARRTASARSRRPPSRSTVISSRCSRSPTPSTRWS
ncbi:MAG: hypothetical protein DMD67_03315 [Gemmatimonadetes bacterium]|nr:MAG: hypothetical protein DMD67_03315 [Gemmatimonadota bacterium]